MQLPGGQDAVELVVALIAGVAAPPPMSCKVLAIDGPGGSGKSTLAARVAEQLGGVPVIETDNFASWINALDWYPRLVEQVLEPLAAGRAARYQRYDWDTQRLGEWHDVRPGEYLIIEGVSSSRLAFRPYLAASVWVETARPERLRRGLERDGQDALALWQDWMAAEDDYIAREHPERHADLVVSGQPD
ncbi:MAG: hypothetical protein ABSG64_02980 [Solirubrobacteraceae bacterium]|jgi:uridine kinase